ncbi:MAG: DNA-processing protein DprA [Prevotella sp.]|nr:DNA-processing protein DprA [Prevotella sp.]
MPMNEILNAIALTRVSYFSLAGMLELYRRMGSATAVMEHRRDIRDMMPDASDRLMEALANVDEPLRRAEAELEFCEHNGIRPLAMNDTDYPLRLRECDDAPLVVYYKGSATLNPQHVVCIVGTRHSTVYGEDLIRRFTQELRALCPQTLIVSGLAYGIDICAHRHALQNGMSTVAVLAHGQDDLYPPRHRQTADEMVRNGGLLTEYPSGTRADRVNFVRRNRIVAGMSDACILVESAAKGGGLITCGIARDYNRDVFAFPGAVGAPYSEGCNNLIRNNGAALITSARDFVESMGWQTAATLQEAQRQGIERQIFPDLTDEERQVVGTLQRTNDLQINMLSVQTGIPIGRLTAVLFSLEMKGVIKNLAGGVYHLMV